MWAAITLTCSYINVDGRFERQLAFSWPQNLTQGHLIETFYLKDSQTCYLQSIIYRDFGFIALYVF